MLLKKVLKILQAVIRDFKAFKNITSQVFTLLKNKARFKQKNEFTLPLPTTKMPRQKGREVVTITRKCSIDSTSSHVYEHVAHSHVY